MKESFEHVEKRTEENSKKEAGMTRRRFMKLVGGGALAFSLDAPRALAQSGEPHVESRYEKHGWLYTLEEMQKIYEEEYVGEKLLQKIVRKKGEKIVGIYQGREFIISPQFIRQVLSHLQSMLEKGAAKFLFRLDASHGHYFFVPEEVFKLHYEGIDGAEAFRMALTDPTLGILYHNSEHLSLDDKNLEAPKLYQKRNVVGWNDGRPITILPLPKGKNTAADIPKGYQDLPITMNFAAHKDGEFSIYVGGKEIRLDLSFDDSSYY